MAMATTTARTSPSQRGCSGDVSADGDACQPEKEEEKKKVADDLQKTQDDDEMGASSRKSCDFYPSLSTLSPASSPPPTCKAAAVAAAAAASLTSTFRSLLMEKPSALRSACFLPWRGRHGKKKKKNDMTKGRSVQRERGTRKTTPLASQTEEEEKGTKKARGFPPHCSTSEAEAFFNMGMGLGIAYVLARWATEFDKMAELHVQMEMLLRELKQQVPTKCISPCIPGQDKNLASSLSDSCREIGTENVIFSQSQQLLLQMEGDNSTLQSKRCTNYETSPQSKGCPGMEELEAELELELEQLQLNLEDDQLVHSEQERMEMVNDSTKSRESFHGDFEPKEENYNEHYVVSARELERRLHELLHTRQQEQIAELEDALKQALVEKEIEVSRWREAAINASNGLDNFGEEL